MIATLSGVITEKLTDSVILEAGGVGYGVYVSTEDHGRLQSGEATKVYVYEHIREQSHDLFGFINREAKKLFEKLLEVNGVGPKMALNMLSIGPAGSVKQAIAEGNVKYLQTASGVGKRVAERVVVDLKDKVGLIGVDLADTSLLQGDESLMKDEAVEALVALGYTPVDAAAALKQVDPTLSVEKRIKAALKS